MQDMTGLMTGLVGFMLGGVGLVLAVLAALRMLWVIRKPGKGHLARGLAVFGLVLLLSGALLVTVEEVDSPIRAASDRSAHYVAGLAVLVALFAGYRSARRRRPRLAEAAPPGEDADPGAHARVEDPPDVAQRS